MQRHLLFLCILALGVGLLLGSGAVMGKENPGEKFLQDMIEASKSIKDISFTVDATLTGSAGRSSTLSMTVDFKMTQGLNITYLLPKEEAGTRLILTKDGGILLPKAGGRPQAYNYVRLVWLDPVMLGLVPFRSNLGDVLTYEKEDKIGSRAAYLFSVDNQQQDHLRITKIWLDKETRAIAGADMDDFMGAQVTVRAVEFTAPQGAGKGNPDFILLVKDESGKELGKLTLREIQKGLWLPVEASLKLTEGDLKVAVRDVKVNSGIKDELFVVKEIVEARRNRDEGDKAYDRKDYARARELLEKAIEFFPNDVTTRNTLGLAYMNLGKYDEAIRWFNEVLSIDPLNAAAYNNLGFTYVESGKDVARGTKLIERAIELDPANPGCLESLGWAHYKAGLLDEAIRDFKRAFLFKDQMPSDLLSTAHYHLAIVYRDKGMAREAIAELEAALRADPGNKAASEELARLRAVK